MIINAENILLDPAAVLREKAEDVVLPLSKENRQLLSDMIEYVRNSHDDEFCKANGIRPSVGIAAPQVGVSKKMIAVSIEEEDGMVEFALANPKIISNSTMKSYLENGESCLSVDPDVQGLVPRYYKITVKGYDLLTDSMVKIRLSGYPAIVMQHEIDHLYGILYYDHIDKNNPFKQIDGVVI